MSQHGLLRVTSIGRDINLEILRVEGYRKFCNKVFNATKFAMLKLDQDFVPSSALKVRCYSCTFSYRFNPIPALRKGEPRRKVDPRQVERGGRRSQRTAGGKELLDGDKRCLQFLALRAV